MSALRALGAPEASGRYSVTALADGAFVLPAGIQWSDLVFISKRVLAIALVISVIGMLLLRRLAARSIGLMVTIVVGVSVVTSLAGIGVIATAWWAPRPNATTCST